MNGDLSSDELVIMSLAATRWGKSYLEILIGFWT